MSPSGDDEPSSSGDDPSPPTDDCDTDPDGDGPDDSPDGRSGRWRRDATDGGTADRGEKGGPDPESGARAGGDPGVDATEWGARHRGESDEPEEEEFGWREFGTDVASSVVAVFLVGFFLFAVSGVWPPLVAVESTSMTPHMKVGDLVFVMDEKRFPGENAHGDTGVVTARTAGDYSKFQQRGDVIVYQPAGNGDTTPIIHRVMFWVSESEDWYDKADRTHLGSADDCSELSHCPAPHAGFVTLGDNNDVYDQARSGLPPVKPAWVVGTAEVRVPALGWVRLRSSRGLVLTHERATALDANATSRPASPRATAG